MAEVKGSDFSLLELTDATLKTLQALRAAQANYAATIRGEAVAAGAAQLITSWSETATNGGQLNVTLTIPTEVTASTDGYNVSAHVSFDDGL